MILVLHRRGARFYGVFDDETAVLAHFRDKPGTRLLSVKMSPAPSIKYLDVKIGRRVEQYAFKELQVGEA